MGMHVDVLLQGNGFSKSGHGLPVTYHHVTTADSHDVTRNKYERRYYGPGRRPLTYLLYGKPRLCINIHHYSPPLIVLQQAAAMHAALHALRRQYTSECSMSSFKSIT